jgi:hypothetical protein
MFGRPRPCGGMPGWCLITLAAVVEHCGIVLDAFCNQLLGKLLIHLITELS